MCLPKPGELTALHDEMPALFDTVRQTFHVAARHALEIESVERSCSEAEEIATTAALVLHYTQSMRVLARPHRRVRITAIVNTSACLVSMLSILAGECAQASVTDALWQIRDRIGIAATAVASVDLDHGGGHKYMQ